MDWCGPAGRHGRVDGLRSAGIRFSDNVGRNARPGALTRPLPVLMPAPVGPPLLSPLSPP